MKFNYRFTVSGGQTVAVLSTDSDIVSFDDIRPVWRCELRQGTAESGRSTSQVASADKMEDSVTQALNHGRWFDFEEVDAATDALMCAAYAAIEYEKGDSR